MYIYQLVTTMLSRLNENILKFGAYAGSVIGTIFIVQLIKQFIALFVNLKMLKATIGFRFHLVGSLFTSLTNYLIINDIYNEGNQEVAEV